MGIIILPQPLPFFLAAVGCNGAGHRATLWQPESSLTPPPFGGGRLGERLVTAETPLREPIKAYKYTRYQNNPRQ